jgi:glycosyltransferase involved in cell wall biosynthesis
MRIGILAHGFTTWGGGIDFLRTICSSLSIAAPEEEIHVLLPSFGPHVLKEAVKNALRTALLRPAKNKDAPSREHIENALHSLGGRIYIHHIDSGLAALYSAIKKHKLSVLLPSMVPLSKSLEVPWVGYIYDFQHRHIPKFFNQSDIDARDRTFKQILDSCDAVIVNARSVSADIISYYPSRRAKVFPLPFSAAPESQWLNITKDFIDQTRQKYNIESAYFIVCNQFWKHKDHGTAFKALSAISAEYPAINLVCTGSTGDFRDPSYFGLLLDLARELEIHSKLRILGLIPKIEQIALLRGSIALIQPTLSEGGPGGGAVYDAVAIGARSIVSDIDVNKELTDQNITFFQKCDSLDLSTKMKNLIQLDASGLTPIAGNLLSEGEARRRECGNALLSAIEHSIARRKS